MKLYKYAASIMFSREGVNSLDFSHSVEIVEASDEVFAHKAAWSFGKANPPGKENGWTIDDIKIKKIVGRNSRNTV